MSLLKPDAPPEKLIRQSEERCLNKEEQRCPFYKGYKEVFKKRIYLIFEWLEKML